MRGSRLKLSVSSGKGRSVEWGMQWLGPSAVHFWSWSAAGDRTVNPALPRNAPSEGGGWGGQLGAEVSGSAVVANAQEGYQ